MHNIIYGDFNHDLLKISSETRISNFYDVVSTLTLVPTITKPTRIEAEFYSIHDKILISHPDSTGRESSFLAH